MIAKVENVLLSIATYDGEEQDRIDSEKRQERIKELEAGGTIRRSDSPCQELMDYINDAGDWFVVGFFISLAAFSGTVEWALDSGPLTIERIFTLIGWAI